MTPNTTFFADFIKGARTTANLTQDNLHDRGASYRQLQGRIENGDLIELEDGVLAAYDRAYGWPLGYAAAVAQAAAYASGAEAPAVNLAEGGNEGGHPGMAGHPARNTLAALYEPGRHSAPPAIGFDPATGRAVYIGPGILTNIAFRELQAVLNSRWVQHFWILRCLMRAWCAAWQTVSDRKGSTASAPMKEPFSTMEAWSRPSHSMLSPTSRP